LALTEISGLIRPTRKDAQDYHRYIVYENGDWESADYAFRRSIVSTASS
jgi:hypothetical protein